MSRAVLRTALCPLRQSWLRAAHDSRALQTAFQYHATTVPVTRCRDVRNHSTSSTSGNTSSVNASEVSHFTKLASSWWDPHGPSRLLHLMNPLRHDFIQSCLRTSTAPVSFTTTEHATDITSNPERGQDNRYTYLDIGCGGGIFASSAARLPGTLNVTAIDPTAEVIRVAKEHQRADPLLSSPGRLNYLNCAIEELDEHVAFTRNDKASQTHSKAIPASTAQYDIISLFEVIEHISTPSTFLRTALAHLKPGGHLVGSTIARHPVSYITTKLIAEAPWPIGVVPAGTHDWDQYINPEEVVSWFEKENVDARNRGEEDIYGKVHIEGCVYVPLVGWKWINGSERVGNYFFGVQKLR